MDHRKHQQTAPKNRTTKEREVTEGDTVVFTSCDPRNEDEKTEGEVTEVYDNGSYFMVEWESNGEDRGQVFTPKVFDRSAFIEHKPTD